MAPWRVPLHRVSSRPGFSTIHHQQLRILESLGESSRSLEAKVGEAGEDVEQMRIAARVACAAQEFAERSFESGMGLLKMASAEIRAAMKEME